jgi:hypothetical protein
MRDDRGRFLPGPDRQRHVLTTAERRKGGQTAWLRFMEDRPELLRWLQRKIDRTARAETLVAYRRRRRAG